MVLEAASKETGLPVYATATAPKVAGFQLKPGTKVGLIRGANNMPGGWLMWQLDQHEVDYKVVSADDYSQLDALYDTILMPDGISQSRIISGSEPEHGAGALPLGARRRPGRAGTRSPRSCGTAGRWWRSAPPATPPRRC